MTVQPVAGSGPRVAALAAVLPPLRVEEEFLLVWPDGDAACVAPEVLDAVARELRARPGSTGFQVAGTTGVRAELSDVARRLSVARRALAEAAADQGARLLALGTPPYDVPDPDPVAGESGTCACVVSVPVSSTELGAAVLDRCRAWLPTLLALTGNSALWRGRDTGWSSSRFALEEGAAPGAASCVPDPSGQAAVEFRLADTCPTVADAVLLAGLCRGLVATALAQEAAGRPRPLEVPDAVLAASTRAAARWGLQAYVLDPGRGGPAPASTVLDALLVAVAPALGAAGDLPVVTSLLHERLRRGSGADRQRALRRRCDRRALVQTLANTCAGVDRRD